MPALLVILVMNIAAFAAFPSVGGAVGAATGTDGYEEIAENVVQGNGLVFAPGMRSTGMLGYMKREPIYPLFLSGVLGLTGALSPLVLCTVQTALCLISCCLIYFLGRIVFGSTTAITASYVYALHPVSFWYSARFVSEMVAVPVCLLCLLAIIRLLGSPSRMRAVQAGLMLGVAALTKSAYVVALPLVVLFMIVRGRRELRLVLPLAVITFVCYGAIHSVWLIRNYAMAAQIVPFTTMNGFSFFVGKKIIEEFDITSQTGGSEPDRWADALYRSVQADIAAAEPKISMPGLEARTDRRLMTMAGQLALEHPWLVVQKLLAGMVLIWYLSDTTAKSLGWMIFQVPLVAVALIGLYRERHWTVAKGFLLSVAAAYILSYAVVSPLARYGMVVVPIVMLFASHELTGWCRTWTKRRHHLPQRAFAG